MLWFRLMTTSGLSTSDVLPLNDGKQIKIQYEFISEQNKKRRQLFIVHVNIKPLETNTVHATKWLVTI